MERVRRDVRTLTNTVETPLFFSRPPKDELYANHHVVKSACLSMLSQPILLVVMMEVRINDIDGL